MQNALKGEKLKEFIKNVNAAGVWSLDFRNLVDFNDFKFSEFRTVRELILTNDWSFFQ